MESLPQELFDEVFRYLVFHDLLSLHRVSKTLAEVTISLLFRSITFSLTPKSWERIHVISQDPKLLGLVEELVLEPKLLPTYYEYNDWLSHIDARPFKGQFFHDMLGKQKSESSLLVRPEDLERAIPNMTTVDEDSQGSVHTMPPDYQQLWLNESWDAMARWPDDSVTYWDNHRRIQAWQETLLRNPDLLPNFKKLLQRFPKLRSLREKSWDNDWYDTRFRSVHGSSHDLLRLFDPADWCLYLLKPKNTLYKNQDLDELAESSADMMSIFQARTIGPRLLFGAMDPAIGGDLSLRRLQDQITSLAAAIGLNGWDWEAEGNRWYEIENDIDSSEHTLATEIFIAMFGTFRVPNLTSLELEISYTSDVRELLSLLSSAANVLDSAEQLTALSIQISSTNDCVDMLEPLRKVHMQKLKTLSLTTITTKQDSLVQLFASHSSSLRSLSLYEIHLFRGRWVDLLQGLPNILSLEKLNPSCLMDDGDARNKAFLGPHSANLSQVREYVCSGGRTAWMPLDNAIEETAVDAPSFLWDWSK